MKRKRVLVDMDNTLISSASACMELYQKDKQIRIDWNIKDLEWNFQPYVPKDDFNMVINYFNDQRMYDIAEPMKDSVDVLERLHKNFEIVVVTKSHRYALPYKANWLYNTYGDSIDRVVFLSQKDFNKAFIEGCAIIDDKVQPLEGGNREAKILFGDYFYNQYENLTKSEKNIVRDIMNNGECLVRMNNWLDIEKYLNCLLTHE